MHIINKCIALLMFAVMTAACSGTVKGPVTGNTYKVNVGSCADVETYREVREEAKTGEDADRPVTKPREARNVEDCPGSVREGVQP